MPKFARVSVVLSILVATALPSAAQEFRPASVTLQEGTFAGRTFGYRVMVPDDLREDEKLPVVLFLHGAGERGDDNEAQLRHFPDRMVRTEYRERFRSIVVAPQCANGSMWIPVRWDQDRTEPAELDSPWLDVALAALRKTLSEVSHDPDRIYLTGLSMGGFGSWHLSSREPKLFAAAAPICGGGYPATAVSLGALPILAVHGGADRVVPPSRSREMIVAARRAGTSAHYVELPGVGHDSWNQAYALEGAVLDWLFEQRRGRPYLGHVMGCNQAIPAIELRDVRSAALSWSWDGEGLSDDQRAWFDHPTDVRPVDLGTAALVVASGGGLFRVRLVDRKVEFAAHVGGNPHAVAALHDGSALVASSQGNALTRWSLEDPTAQLQSIELRDAHGVVQDAESRLIWALGGDELITLVLGEEGLEVRDRYPLPATGDREPAGGHDLVFDRTTGLLFLSDVERLWTFDRTERAFSPFAPLPRVKDVKSITRLGARGPLLLVQANESWWSDRGRFVGAGDVEFRIDGARFYKLRTWP
jgi:poly(3-hydroxybutyrate) depolymerase